VVDFFVSAVQNDLNNYVIELKADGMGIINGRDSTGTGLTSIAFTNTNNTFPQSTYGYSCENFNGRTIRFQLFDEYGTQLQLKAGGNFNKAWILVLKITPLD
jgi:hypothetical protein